MTRNHVLLTAALGLALAACGSKPIEPPEPKGFPRDFASTKKADEAVPAAMRQDYEALLSCRGDMAAKRGERVPELDNDRIADVVDELRRNPRAAEQCIEKLHG